MKGIISVYEHEHEEHEHEHSRLLHPTPRGRVEELEGRDSTISDSQKILLCPIDNFECPQPPWTPLAPPSARPFSFLNIPQCPPQKIRKKFFFAGFHYILADLRVVQLEGRGEGGWCGLNCLVGSSRGAGIH